MRLFDITLSIFLIALLSPILFIIIILVKYNLGTPVFFKQSRPGINGKPFLIYKFRTMKYITDSKGNQLPDYKRLGSFGKFLRSTSIDELPELGSDIEITEPVLLPSIIVFILSSPIK